MTNDLTKPQKAALRILNHFDNTPYRGLGVDFVGWAFTKGLPYAFRELYGRGLVDIIDVGGFGMYVINEKGKSTIR